MILLLCNNMSGFIIQYLLDFKWLHTHTGILIFKIFFLWAGNVGKNQYI